MGFDPYSRKVLLGRPSALAGQLCEVVKICLDLGYVHPFLVPSPGNQFRTIIHNLSNNFAYQVFGAVARDCLSFRQAFGPVTSVPNF